MQEEFVEGVNDEKIPMHTIALHTILLPLTLRSSSKNGIDYEREVIIKNTGDNTLSSFLRQTRKRRRKVRGNVRIYWEKPMSTTMDIHTWKLRDISRLETTRQYR